MNAKGGSPFNRKPLAGSACGEASAERVVIFDDSGSCKSSHAEWLAAGEAWLRAARPG
ncbi:MAG TPA: hypothetical protein VF668_07755 [Pyrinomonadaceae bacterium]